MACPLFDVGPPNEPPPSDVMPSERPRANERTDSPVTDAERTRSFGNRDLLTKLFHVAELYRYRNSYAIDPLADESLRNTPSQVPA
jgi:hypothetical protein